MRLAHTYCRTLPLAERHLITIKQALDEHDGPLGKSRPSEIAVDVADARMLGRRFTTSACLELNLLDWHIVQRAVGVRYLRAKKGNSHLSALFHWIELQFDRDPTWAAIRAAWKREAKAREQLERAQANLKKAQLAVTFLDGS